MTWCPHHPHFSQNNWQSAIFSDQSTFYVLERKNQVKIWRTDEERLHQQVSTGKGGKLGIWRSISGQRPTEVRIFDKNMDEQTYCDVLNHELKRSIAILPDKGKII